MKGDETENKKIGCTVNLLVRFIITIVIYHYHSPTCWFSPKIYQIKIPPYKYVPADLENHPLIQKFYVEFYQEMKLCVCFVSFQNFYKSEINKEEMYIRYIHKLCDMHLQAENYTGMVHTDRHTCTYTLKHTHTHTQTV